MKEIYRSTYREIHIPAADLVAFMQSIYGSDRVGTLTISFSTGGVPNGMMVWRERVVEPALVSGIRCATCGHSVAECGCINAKFGAVDSTPSTPAATVQTY